MTAGIESVRSTASSSSRGGQQVCLFVPLTVFGKKSYRHSCQREAKFTLDVLFISACEPSQIHVFYCCF